ncbi:uncharacterized protein LOC144573012 [Carex rostrata]
MGLWDYVRSATETISGAVTRSRAIVGGAFGKARAAAPDLTGALKNTRDLAKVASEATVETSQAVVERMPDREGLQRIGRFGLRIADHAIEQGTNPFIGNMYRFVKKELSKNKSQEQPVKENLEKEESLEKKLVEIKQNDINQKGKRRSKL